MPIRVVIIEDDSQTRAHLAALVQGTPGLDCIGRHATAEMALKHLSIVKPDVVLLDLELPTMSGLDLIPKLDARSKGIEILVLTIHDDAKTLFQALEAGASGYLVKPAGAARIVEAIEEVASGGSPMSAGIARLVIQTFHKRGREKEQLSQLTKREAEILDHLAKGLRRKEIAVQLGLSHRTVGTHLKNIYEKLQVNSATAALAKRRGAN